MSRILHDDENVKWRDREGELDAKYNKNETKQKMNRIKAKKKKICMKN